MEYAPQGHSAIPGYSALGGAGLGMASGWEDFKRTGEIPWWRIAGGAALGAGAGIGGLATLGGAAGRKQALGYLAGGVTGSTGRLANAAKGRNIVTNYDRMRMLSIPGLAGTVATKGVIDPILHGDGGQPQQQAAPYAAHASRYAGGPQRSPYGYGTLPPGYNPYYNYRNYVRR